MEFLPVFIKCRGRPVLVVGGGMIAMRKIRVMNKAGMSVKVVAPRVVDQIALLAKHGTVTLVQRTFKDEDIKGMFMVIAATNDQQLNHQISVLSRQSKIPVNSADSSDDSDFIFPTTINRDPIQIAVSTGGASPLLARLLAKHLGNCTPPAYAGLASLMGRYRQKVKSVFDDLEQRRLFWEKVLCGRVSDLMFSGRPDEAEQLFLRILQNVDCEASRIGEVYLVGAGPGDPDLLTFKALRLMQQSDVVIYDRLVSKPIMDLLPLAAKKIYAGKERDKHAIEQGSINKLLVDYAKKGHRVLRLKGGDPFIFGRGGEEIETLMEESIPFQIVPGITAASGCAAYAGIPLTHRDYAQVCLFVTGHLKNGKVDLDWSALARPRQTVVIYMGLHGLEEICGKLIEHGLAADTPAAMVTRGTTPEQSVLVSTLSDLPGVVVNEEVKPPTMVIIGQVVALHYKLRWLDQGEAESDN